VSDSVATADTLASGTRIGQLLAGKYRLERLLGRGGMGEVYEARHAVVGRRFAIKFLHAAPAPGSIIAARFLREAQAAGALESPHIAAVLDFDVAPDGAPFLVMEYLAGETLSHVLRREKRLALPRVISILLQACSGLSVAHRAGIVHRDLKPENLFLVARPDGSELLKVVDFGIAKLLGDPSCGDVTQSGAVLGTPYYMAPEQARGERNIDQRVDVHALGVIGYELLSGLKPHPGDSYNAILAHILTESVMPLEDACPTLPKRVCEVIDRAMAHDADERYDSVETLAKDLTELAGREIRLHGDAVDLRDRTTPEPSSAEAATKDDSAASVDAPSTLGSVAGDVQAPLAKRAPRRATPLLAVAAVAAAILWLSARRGAAPAEPTVERRERPVTTTASLVPRSDAPSALAATSSSAAAIPSSWPQISSASATPKAVPAPPPPATPTASSKKRAARAASEFTFDEQNPY